MKNMRSLVRAFICALILASARMPAIVNAQTTGITLSVNGYDSSNYPDVICTVTPVNNAGVPLQKLDQSSFQVLDANTSIPITQVQQITGNSVKDSVMLLVDFGMVHRGQSLQPLKDSAKAILQAAGNDDRLGIIALTGPVSVDSKLDPAKEFGFASVSQKRNDMINLITGLDAVGSTPLYDAVCKALLLTAQENVGSRAVIVLSDGADVKSKVCGESDPITRANHDRTPVFTIGVGPVLKEAYLRKLALQTDGDYESAAQVQNVIEIFKRIETELRTQYTIAFHMPGESNGQPKTVDIQVTQGANKAVDHAQFATPAPLKPKVEKVTFTIDGAEVNPMSLPANKTVVVEPQISAQSPITEVEYDVGGTARKIGNPPFQLVIATNDLIGLTKITLKAAGNPARPDSVTISDILVGIDPATLVTPTPVPTPTPTPSPLSMFLTFPGILIPVAAIAILLLLALLMVLLARRRAQMREQLTPHASPTMITTNPTFGGGSATAIINSSPTAIINDQSPPEGATMILGGGGGQTLVFKPAMAVLEFTSGNLAGQQFGIGSTNMESLSIGREPEAGPGAVRISSPFVSRKHASITVDGDRIYLTDLGSSSGTKLNGDRLAPSQPHEIKIGDKIEFADSGAELKKA